MHSNYEGVIILGAPRSGTTLLRRLIDCHPLIACPPETNLLSAASRFLEESHFAGGMSVGVVPGLSFSGFSEEEIIERLKNFLFGFWTDILANTNKKIWAEKTAVDVFHLDAIERICGTNCKYVCITRHALDVVCSMKDLSEKMDAYLPELHEYVKKYLCISEAAARAWTDANRRMIKFSTEYSEWCIRLKYEDLVKEPVSQMNRIFRFLDVEECDILFIDSALKGTQSVGLGDWKTYDRRSITSKYVGRWEKLDNWTVQRLAPIVDPVLKQLDYEETGFSQSNLPSDERHAQELARMVAAMKLQGGGDTASDA